MRNVDIEACIRAKLKAPPGAAEWLTAILLSCGREFGRHPGKLPMLIGVLSSELTHSDSQALSELFFSPSEPSFHGEHV